MTGDVGPLSRCPVETDRDEEPETGMVFECCRGDARKSPSPSAKVGVRSEGPGRLILRKPDFPRVCSWSRRVALPQSEIISPVSAFGTHLFRLLISCVVPASKEKRVRGLNDEEDASLAVGGRFDVLLFFGIRSDWTSSVLDLRMGDRGGVLFPSKDQYHSSRGA